MKLHLLTIGLFVFCSAFPQENKQQYPTPEFENEIYFLNKDSSSLIRLEKGNSGLKTKLRLAGFAGSENSFVIENDKSPVRIRQGSTSSFIYYTGELQASSPALPDTVTKSGKNGSTAYPGWETINNPSQTTTLYSAFSGQGERKVVIQSGAGMRLLGKVGESKKYTFSVRKIRPGYMELIIDKTLPKGEYVFVVLGGLEINFDGSALLFAFGID